MNSRLDFLQAVSAYVPTFLVQRAIEWLEISPGTPLGLGIQLQKPPEASLLLAGVSGFTSISRALAARGQAGAEELTQILDRLFTDIIELVHAHGGDVIRFEGSRLIVFFPRNPSHSWTSNLEQALACAFALQARMANFQNVDTSAGKFPVRMKIGMSAGEVRPLNAFITSLGMTFTLAGQVLNLAATAEHHADDGEVVTDAATLERVESSVVISEKRNGFAVISALREQVQSHSAPRFDFATLDVVQVEQLITQLVPYLPPTVYRRLLTGVRASAGEYQHLTSLHSVFNIPDPVSQATTEKLAAYFSDIQPGVQGDGGYASYVLIGGQSCLLHALFGGPTVAQSHLFVPAAHEDSEVRAVLCAQTIHHLLERRPVPMDVPEAIRAQLEEHASHAPHGEQRIGLATENMFTGIIGSNARREYVVIGDALDLSRQLMETSLPGSISLDSATAERVREKFSLDTRPLILNEGGPNLVLTYALTGKREAARRLQLMAYPPSVKGQRETAMIDFALTQAWMGQGQVLALIDESRINRTQLAEKIIQRWLARDGQGYAVDCCLACYGNEPVLQPWKALWTAAFQLSPNDEPPQKMEKIKELFEVLYPDSVDKADAIYTLVALDSHDRAKKMLTAAQSGISNVSAMNRDQMDVLAQSWLQTLNEVTIDLLRAMAKQQPLVLLFTDIHWMDSRSLDWLHSTGAHLADAPILFVLTHSPFDIPEPAPYRSLRQLGHYTALEPQELSS